MADDQPTERSPKRSLLRKVLWVLGGGLGLLFLVNVLLPDLDLSGEDRIALIRIEGVILDAQETLGELKKFSENPSVKAIVWKSTC